MSRRPDRYPFDRIPYTLSGLQRLQVTAENGGLVYIVVLSVCEPPLEVMGMYIRVVVIVEMKCDGVAKDLHVDQSVTNVEEYPSDARKLQLIAPLDRIFLHLPSGGYGMRNAEKIGDPAKRGVIAF